MQGKCVMQTGFSEARLVLLSAGTGLSEPREGARTLLEMPRQARPGQGLVPSQLLITCILICAENQFNFLFSFNALQVVLQY